MKLATYAIKGTEYVGSVVGDKDTLAGTAFETDDLLTVAVDGDAVQTATGRNEGGS